jgi:16S rRNA processing protein RimM
MAEESAEESAKESFVTVARIRRPQGRRGEVAAELLTDFPERFHTGDEYSLWKPGEDRRPGRLQEFWFHKGGVILKFEGFEDISSAEQLAGWQVQIPLSSRVKLEGDTSYVSDLVGCRVIEQGVELGIIEDVDDRSGTPLLVVTTPQGELLVPFASEICRRVDVAAKRVEVVLPAGLRDLNSGV